jgi:hypothetical protein
MIPGPNKDQLLVAIAVRKLLTLGYLPDDDWKLLHSHDKSGLPFAAFKAKMLEELPAYFALSRARIRIACDTGFPSELIECLPFFFIIF